MTLSYSSMFLRTLFEIIAQSASVSFFHAALKHVSLEPRLLHFFLEHA